MNRKHTIHAVIAAALATSLSGHAAPAEQPNPEFTRLDVNGDGYLTWDEASRIRGFEKAFHEADDNRDGRLTEAEFVKAQSVHERERAAQFVDDSVVTAKVKAALLKDPVVSGFAVSVETYKGTVLLSGFVDSEVQAKRAAEVAAGVKGVVSVKNGIAVKS